MTVPTSLPILTAAVAAFFLVNTAIGLALGFALERFSSKRVWALPVPAGQYRHELRGNVNFVLASIVALTAALASGVPRYGPETWTRFGLTFGALSLGFQAFYYALHRAMHHPRLVRFHRHHHASHVTTPLSGQSTSAVEAVGWMLGYVAMPVLISLVLPISLNAWLWYLAYNVIGNIVGHANVEIVKPTPTLWLTSTLVTVFTYHALHHARWTGHYSFASTWADRLFKTEWPDWLPLHARVWSGHPMTSLKQRGDGEPSTGPPADR